MKIYELPTLYLQCFSMIAGRMLCVDATYDVLCQVVDSFDSDDECLQIGIDAYEHIKTFAHCFNYMKNRIKSKYAEAMEEYLQTEWKLIKRVKAKHRLNKLQKALLNCDIFELSFNKTLNVNIEEIYSITKDENEFIEEESEII